MACRLRSVGFVVISLTALAARGDILLSDSFAYTDGPLVSVSSGLWVHHSPSGSATGQVQVASGRALISQTNSEDVSALLAGQPYPATTNVNLYAGFLINYFALPSGAGDYFAHFKPAGSSGFRCRIFATTNGVSPGFFQVGIANSNNVPTAMVSSNLSLNTDYLLVVRYAPSNASSTLWVNPAAETDPGVSATDTASTVSVTAFALREDFSGPDGMGGLQLDNVMVGTSFGDVLSTPAPSPPGIIAGPQSQIVLEGADVKFSVTASGAAPLYYQWQFYGTNFPGATDSVLALTAVRTNQAGPYQVTITNTAGTTNSQPATLTVNPAFVSILTYNVHGNGSTNWSTNTLQAQAIGRELNYLNPDVITFNEIPNTNTWQMTNWITAFLPGYSLATNSGTDGFIRSVIASRYPITRSQKWLDGVSLTNFGFNGHFARDLFEAQISVPNFVRPLHVFTTHLKATVSTPQDDADQRAAEASAISNFFVTVYLSSNSMDPYVLTGDMNEDVFLPETNKYVSGQPIQRLVSPPTGLFLTTPVNPITHTDLTESIQATLNERFDYILPCGWLLSNVASSQVFRTDLLTNPPPPPPLLTNDDRTASDHLPVMMTFGNPYTQPFSMLSISRIAPSTTLSWQSVPGQVYRLETSSNLGTWNVLATNLAATGAVFTIDSIPGGDIQFYRARQGP